MSLSRARRDYWCKLVHETAVRHSKALRLCGNLDTQITDVPQYAQKPLADKCAEIYDRCCTEDENQSFPEGEIAQRADRDLWRFLFDNFNARNSTAPLE